MQYLVRVGATAKLAVWTLESSCFGVRAQREELATTTSALCNGGAQRMVGRATGIYNGKSTEEEAKKAGSALFQLTT